MTDENLGTEWSNDLCNVTNRGWKEDSWQRSVQRAVVAIYTLECGSYKATRIQYASPPRQCNDGSSLERFWQNFVDEGFIGAFSSAKFQHYGYKNVGLSSTKSQKFRIFCKYLPLRDKSPSAIFTKLGVGEGVSGLNHH